MTKASKLILSTTAEILNRHVTEQTAFGAALSDGVPEAQSAMAVINEILLATAEGATLVCARELNGALLGFVPRADVVLPDLKPRPTPIPPSPDT